MAIPASNARENLFPLIAEVNENSSAVHITSKSGNAVLISESEYEKPHRNPSPLFNSRKYKSDSARD
jgi:prevent-host-death family protein